MALRWITGLSAICVLFLVQTGIFSGREAVSQSVARTQAPAGYSDGAGFPDDSGRLHDASRLAPAPSGVSASVVVIPDGSARGGPGFLGPDDASAGAGLVAVSDLQHPVPAQNAPAGTAAWIQLAQTPFEAVLQAEASTSPVALDLPATFAGDLACGDCDGLRYRLTLWQDDVFYLHREWLGTDLVEDSIGRWSLDAGRGVVVLSAGQAPLEFEVLDPGRLRLLEATRSLGQAAAGQELASEAGVEPVDMHVPVRGMIAFGADGGTVSECLTGRTYTLTQEGDYSTLEAAFLAAGVAPGSRLLATFEAQLADAPGSAPEEAAQVVTVERFTGVWPEETCARTQSNVSLTDTYWKIVRLGQTDIVAGEAMGEPHMVLRSGHGQFEATVGCNTLSGAFEADGQRLALDPSERTHSPCPPVIGDWEQQFADVLTMAQAWRIDGQMLELLGKDGSQIALFQAVLLR